MVQVDSTYQRHKESSRTTEKTKSRQMAGEDVWQEDNGYQETALNLTAAT